MTLLRLKAARVISGLCWLGLLGACASRGPGQSNISSNGEGQAGIQPEQRISSIVPEISDVEHDSTCGSCRYAYSHAGRCLVFANAGVVAIVHGYKDQGSWTGCTPLDTDAFAQMCTGVQTLQFHELKFLRNRDGASQRISFDAHFNFLASQPSQIFGIQIDPDGRYLIAATRASARASSSLVWTIQGACRLDVEQSK